MLRFKVTTILYNNSIFSLCLSSLLVHFNNTHFETYKPLKFLKLTSVKCVDLVTIDVGFCTTY